MSKTRSSKTFFIGVAVALLLPLSFYLFFIVKLKHHVRKLPDYYFAQIDTVRHDTTYHKAAPIAVTNQLGKNVDINRALAGKCLLINFFSINSSMTCASLMKNMAQMQRVFSKDPKEEFTLQNAIQFVSISTDSARDGIGALRKCADRYGANHDRWWFVSGNVDSIRSYARNELNLSFGAGSACPSDQWVLLDKHRYIRGYYNGLDTLEMRRCADDIVLVSLENDPRK